MSIERQRDQWPHRSAVYEPPTVSSPSSYGTPRWKDHRERPIQPDGTFYFSPTEVNPRPNTEARPDTSEKYFTPTGQPPLPLTGPDLSSPGANELHRGVRLHLDDSMLHYSPAMARIRRLLKGNDMEEHENWGYENDGHYNERLPGMPTNLEAAGGPHPLGYDHPELPHLLLEHLYNHGDPEFGQTPGSLGRHWSTSKGQASLYARIFPGQSLGAINEDTLSAVLTGRWRGAGEDPYRRNTEGDFPDEQEITLLPGAPLNLHQVHLFNPHTREWHVHDLGGAPHTAARLARYDDEDEDYYPGPVGLRSPLFRSDERPSHYSPHDMQRRHYFLPHDHNPASDAESRPYLEFPLDGDHYERPTLDLKLPPSKWTDYDRPLPPGHSNGIDHIPTGSSGAELYRGINVDMRVPQLAALRRAIYGPDKESYYQGDPNSVYMNKKRNWPAQPHQPGMFPGVFSDRDLAAPPADPDRMHQHLPALLDHLADWHPKQGIGKHWSTDFDQATDFASPNSIYNDEYGMLPVRLTGKWKGRGEDPYRRDVGETYPGEYSYESELSLLPGAPINLTNVEYFHPRTKQWHSMFDGDPRPIQAGKKKKKAPKPPWGGPKKMWFMTDEGLHHSLEDTFTQSSPAQLYQLLRTDNTFAQQYRDHLNRTHNLPPETPGREFVGLLHRAYPDVFRLLGDL